jgi:hypothetical protein
MVGWQKMAGGAGWSRIWLIRFTEDNSENYRVLILLYGYFW